MFVVFFFLVFGVVVVQKLDTCSNEQSACWKKLYGSTVAFTIQDWAKGGLYPQLDTWAQAGSLAFPGSRYDFGSTFYNGDYYIFGGQGVGRDPGPAGNPDYGFLNDLWRFSRINENHLFQYMAGSQIVDLRGSYASFDFSSQNVIGGRRSSLVFATSGSVFVFGGWGYNSLGPLPLGDFWEFDIGTSLWKYLGGYNETDWGTHGMSYPSSYYTWEWPASRYHATGFQTTGAFWVFGGKTYGKDVSTRDANLNDLWRYDVAEKTWRFVCGGKDYQWEHPSVTYKTPTLWYGTENRAFGTGEYKGRNENNQNFPQKRYFATGFVVGDDLFIFGGKNFPHEDPETGNPIIYNDLWKFNIMSETWSHLAGGKDRYVLGKPFYTAGRYPEVEDDDDQEYFPGARFGAMGWAKEMSRYLYMFGGFGRDGDPNGDELGSMNDLWKFDLRTNKWEYYDIVRFGDTILTPGLSDDSAQDLRKILNLGRDEAKSEWEKYGVYPRTRALGGAFVMEERRLYLFAGGWRDVDDKAEHFGISDMWYLNMDFECAGIPHSKDESCSGPYSYCVGDDRCICSNSEGTFCEDLVSEDDNGITNREEGDAEESEVAQTEDEKVKEITTPMVFVLINVVVLCIIILCCCLACFSLCFIFRVDKLPLLGCKLTRKGVKYLKGDLGDEEKGEGEEGEDGEQQKNDERASLVADADRDDQYDNEKEVDNKGRRGEDRRDDRHHRHGHSSSSRRRSGRDGHHGRDRDGRRGGHYQERQRVGRAAKKIDRYQDDYEDGGSDDEREQYDRKRSGKHRRRESPTRQKQRLDEKHHRGRSKRQHKRRHSSEERNDDYDYDYDDRKKNDRKRRRESPRRQRDRLNQKSSHSRRDRNKKSSRRYGEDSDDYEEEDQKRRKHSPRRQRGKLASKGRRKRRDYSSDEEDDDRSSKKRKKNKKDKKRQIQEVSARKDDIDVVNLSDLELDDYDY